MQCLYTSTDTSIDDVYYEDEPSISQIKEFRETFFINRLNSEKKESRKVSFNELEVVLLFEESDPPLMVSEDLILYQKQTGTNLKLSRYPTTSILKKGI
ncbi:unnamed protein product [Paramecium primaurelia]|uniref:Uncharacterized protein n=2 Tax=Paramecium TaxID=5884 RepID=A0A8S1X5W5_9CILI|nr:unnamed protein product [Paramecium primaurelia]CAD8196320.1 unnamed protein product [Paramecium pentaurelia]